MPDTGRTASRIIAAALLLSLAATILLIVQNNDAFVYAGIATILCAVTLLALPSVLFVFGSRRAAQPEITRAMRTAVTVSSSLLIVLGALSLYVVREGGWLVPGALFLAFGIFTMVRAWRTPVPAVSAGSPKMVFGGSLAVGVLFVLLAIVAIPKFACACGGTKEKAYVAQMKSVLLNLATAEEAYFSDHLRYASKDELGAELGNVSYLTTTGVTLVNLVAQDTTGFYAYVSHSTTTQQCGIWVGMQPADGMHDAREGEPKCWPAPAPQ